MQTELASAYRSAGFPEADDFARNEPDFQSFRARLADISEQHTLVFLIDEWDKPLTDHFANEALGKALRAELVAFSNWLRTLRNVRFLLLTGVMRYQGTLSRPRHRRPQPEPHLCASLGLHP